MIPNRRSILAGIAMVAAAPAAMAQQTTAHSGELPPSLIWTPYSRTAKEFSMRVIGPAELSRVTSQLSVDMSSDARANSSPNSSCRVVGQFEKELWLRAWD